MVFSLGEWLWRINCRHITLLDREELHHHLLLSELELIKTVIREVTEFSLDMGLVLLFLSDIVPFNAFQTWIMSVTVSHKTENTTDMNCVNFPLCICVHRRCLGQIWSLSKELNTWNGVNMNLNLWVGHGKESSYHSSQAGKKLPPLSVPCKGYATKYWHCAELSLFL